MPISYPLDFPATGIAQIRLIGRPVVAVTRSPFSLKRQTQVYPGQAWEAELAFPQMKKDKARAVEAFLLSLNGREGTFKLGDPDGTTPNGVASGTPLVNGANQVGSSLNIDGCNPSVTGWLKAGDYVQIGTGANARLHRQLVDVNSNGSGQVTLTLWPRLRESPADNAAIILSNTYGIFALSENAMQYDINVESIHQISLRAQEVV